MDKLDSPILGNDRPHVSQDGRDRQNDQHKRQPCEFLESNPQVHELLLHTHVSTSVALKPRPCEQGSGNIACDHKADQRGRDLGNGFKAECISD